MKRLRDAGLNMRSVGVAMAGDIFKVNIVEAKSGKIISIFIHYRLLWFYNCKIFIQEIMMK